MDPNGVPLVDPNDRTIPLEGFPLAIVIVSAIFFILSAILVAIRSWSRIQGRVFGWDDGLMCAGTVVYASVTGTGIYACLIGVGTRQSGLNAWLGENSMKWYVIWILQYVMALGLVKSSICLTIMRIAGTRKGLRISIYVLLGLTWASFFVTFIGTLLYCRPTEAMWRIDLVLSGEGTCASVGTFVAIGHVATSSTIVTDMALAVLPGWILWNTQMKKQVKLQVFGLLSFASLASIITIVRIPYINKFSGGTDLQFWIAHILLCSNIETGIGCITSSIPSLRRVIRGNNSSADNGASGGSTLRYGSKPAESGRDRFRNPTDVGFSLTTVKGRSDDQWERLEDEGKLLSSQDDHKGIRADYTFVVETNTADSVRSESSRP